MEKQFTPVSSNLRLFSGKEIDIFNLKESDIDITDIAHALSMICRFGGHVKRFYCVAQHSIWICNNLPEEYKLEGLLHDASEGYLIDIPTPIKRGLLEYIELETKVMKVIFGKFDMEYPMSEKVKLIDNAALQYEYNNIVIANNIENVLSPEEAEKEFLQMFYKLYYERKERISTNG